MSGRGILLNDGEQLFLVDYTGEESAVPDYSLLVVARSPAEAVQKGHAHLTAVFHADEDEESPRTYSFTAYLMGMSQRSPGVWSATGILEADAMGDVTLPQPEVPR